MHVAYIVMAILSHLFFYGWCVYFIAINENHANFMGLYLLHCLSKQHLHKNGVTQIKVMDYTFFPLKTP